MKRAAATAADLQPGAWLWASFFTMFNDEGLTDCPARIESIDGQDVTFRLFGRGDDTERGEVCVFPLEKFAKGDHLFVPHPGEIAAYIEKERRWANQHLQATTDYRAQLETATVA